MLKRPALRPRESHDVPSTKPAEGTFLHSILRAGETKYYKPEPVYIQNYENYIDNLRKSCERSGVEFVLPKNVLPMPPRETAVPQKVAPVRYIDDAILKVNVLKCGKVRVKIITQMATLYEKYISKNKIPPVKTLAAALKAVGYDEDFVSKLSSKIDKRKNDMGARYKKLELVFNKPSTSSKKKTKKEIIPDADPEEEPEDDDDEDDEDDDAAPDEEAIAADDEDEDDVVVDEEYISDIE